MIPNEFNMFPLTSMIFFVNVYNNIHKKKSYPFPPPHIMITIGFDYISTTFGH